MKRFRGTSSWQRIHELYVSIFVHFLFLNMAKKTGYEYQIHFELPRDLVSPVIIEAATNYSWSKRTAVLAPPIPHAINIGVRFCVWVGGRVVKHALAHAPQKHCLDCHHRGHDIPQLHGS